MKKLIILLCSCCAVLGAKSLQMPHITVSELPRFGNANPQTGPVFLKLRCANHTAQVLPLEIVTGHGGYRNPNENEVLSKVRLPGLSTSEITIVYPAGSSHFGSISWQALSDPNVIIRGKRNRLTNVNFTGVASPSFRPDVFEYLFQKIQKAPMPVSEWPTDSRAYGNPALIVLDSKDQVSPQLREALRLAVARGGRVVVLVMGNDPWPKYAGTEVKGRAFEEKTGFGSWVVLRTSAVDSNPRWKDFVRRKHAAAQRGKWKSDYKRIKWHEKALGDYLRALPQENFTVKTPVLPVPPIPLGMLTLIMVCFVALIGPVNYFMLKKYHSEIWCLVTIPVLSLLFTGAVILGVFFKEGFSSTGKSFVETLLDQRTGLIAARGGFSIYSPRSVGDFRFNGDDMLFFVDPGKLRGEINNGYTFAPSLLRTRMTLNYIVSRSGYCSEKLAVTEKNGTMEVVNGLGVKLDSLYVKGRDGKIFKLASPLEAGARQLLQPFSGRLPQGIYLQGNGYYRAETSVPFYIAPGVVPDKYEHKQIISGRWD